ncbi:MAG: NAD(P)(+) transhydrogenase (Re/Si-specific) subunit alpha, partial [Actinomycetota bacterium]
MRVVVPVESKAGEKRVALLPDIISKLSKAGLSVSIESCAGIHAGASDESYKEQGATIFSASDQRKEFAGADVILSVQPLSPDQASNLKNGAITISFLSNVSAKESIEALAKSGATAFSLEALPRISRAQSMDALTSQALCAGYKAALVAAELSPRFFPLLMTAAGTVTPANVLVLGAGVAGLQAIATSRRLGAVVSAYDVRPSSADEVKSMGATFIDLELEA